MGMPSIPNLSPSISLTRAEAINLTLASIAMEELGLSHILNAEGEKIQALLAATPAASLSDLLALNDSVRLTADTIASTEALLVAKLQSAMNAQIIQGATGPAGPIGPSNGPPGPTGTTGLTGAAGVSGVRGATGASGATGALGAAGAQGTPGTTGSPGAPGSSGAPGLTGATGITGATGTTGGTGPTGPAGAPGAAGVAGPAGTPGVTGAPGAPGSTGPTGTSGTAGTIGPAGAAGPQGIPGATGAPGLAGAAGTTGPSGTIGANGITGPTGNTGASGATGPTGPAGAASAAGAVGPNGPPGPNGPTGTPGPAPSISVASFAFIPPAANASVAAGVPISFNFQKVIGTNISLSGGNTIILNPGVYLVDYSFSGAASGKVSGQLRLNGSVVTATTIYGNLSSSPTGDSTRITNEFPISVASTSSLTLVSDTNTLFFGGPAAYLAALLPLSPAMISVTIYQIS